MAIHHHFQAEDRGALFRPPTMRIFRRRVITSSPDADPGDQQYTVPSWSNRFPETYWYPLSLRWGSNGQLSTLRIKVVLGQGTGKSRQRAEDDHCSPGDRVDLIQMAAGDGPKEKFEKTWFTGYIGQEAMLIQAHPDVESVTLTAYGPELLLSHKVITGMWNPKTSQSLEAMKGTLTAAAAIRKNVWEAHLPVIMNPNGRGNAWGGNTSAEGEEAGQVALNWQLASNTEAPHGYESSVENNKCKVFTSPGATAGELESTHWTAYTALRSVVEWVDNYPHNVISYPRTNWKAIEDILGDTPIGQVNLTGKNLLQAMNAILVPAGFGFALEPWADQRGEHRLIVFKLHDPASFAKVNMAPIVGGNVEMTDACGQRAMVQRVDYLRDNHNVKNHIIVMGDTMITERSLDFHEDAATRDLHPAWNTSLFLMTPYCAVNNTMGGNDQNWASPGKRDEWRERYTLKGSAFLSYAHIYRTFAWNEDGGLSSVIHNGATPPIPYLPDLANYSPKSDAEYAMRRPRPTLPRVKHIDSSVAGTSGALTAPLVLLGIVGDDDSWIVAPDDSYTLNPHRCSIRFKHHDLALWRPWQQNPHLSGGNRLAKLYGGLNFATALRNTLSNDGDKLRIRLTAGFEMDDAVTYTLPRALDSSWPFDSRVAILMPKRWKYRDIDGSTSSSGGSAVVDDGTADPITSEHPMFDYAVNARDTLEDATGHGSVVLRGLHRAYYPGQGLRKLSGREIDLALPGRRGLKVDAIAPIIAGITWHFTGGANKTELLLETGQLGLPD